jgi:hypothetical protein
MKIRRLVFFSLLFGIKANAQCNGPFPPPGINYVYGLDTDNDGFAIFDIQYFIDHTDRPHLESYFGITSSGYNAIYRNHFGVIQPLLYTNTVQNEECGIEYQYSGSGTEFAEQPPCYWPVFIYLSSGLILITVPFNGDEDNDGILNKDEDTNNNQNLMDDDDDNDGVINLKDATNNLATVENTSIALSIYPNPVTNGFLTFESNVAITTVIIYDLIGKRIAENKINSNTIHVDALAAGMYFVRFQSDNGSVTKKITIQ